MHLERVGAITLDGSAESSLTSVVIDPAGDYAYFGPARRLVDRERQRQGDSGLSRLVHQYRGIPGAWHLEG